MRVFKYRGGTEDVIRRDLRTLFENKIYAAPVQCLNDLFEAQVTIHDQTFRVGHLLSVAGLVSYTEEMRAVEDRFLSSVEDFVQCVQTFGIYSLSKFATDELLWAYYADAHRGFCLEYELDELLAYKLAGESWTTVNYQDEVPNIELNDVESIEKSRDRAITKFIGTKSNRWRHEAEIRIVVGKAGLFDYDFRALKAIYFGARSTQHLRRRVMRTMAGRGLRYFEVTPSGKTYALKFSPIPDVFEREVDYRKRIAPVEEGIPVWDEKTSPYRNELLQAIEIVRREPYCEKVTDAYLSLKSTPEAPVFRVTYDRSDGLSQNFFISKQKIDATIKT